MLSEANSGTTHRRTAAFENMNRSGEALAFFVGGSGPTKSRKSLFPTQ